MYPTDSDRRRAKRLATLAALIVVPVVGLAWCFAGIVIYFAAGGTLVGLDETPNEGTAWWAGPAFILASAVALVTVIWTIRAIYRAALGP